MKFRAFFSFLITLNFIYSCSLLKNHNKTKSHKKRERELRGSAEIKKYWGIKNWIKKNPKKAMTLGAVGIVGGFAAYKKGLLSKKTIRKVIIKPVVKKTTSWLGSFTNWWYGKK